MIDELTRETAKKIILDVWYDRANQNNHERISIRESSTGEVYFYLKVDEGDLGKGQIFYSPQPFVEELVRQAQEELGYHAENSSQSTQELALMYWERKIGDTTSILVHNMQDEFNLVLAQQGVLALSIFYEGSKQIPASEKSLIPVKQALEDFSKQRTKRLAFFLNEIKASHTAPQVLFSYFYEEQHELWKIVKQCYKDSQKYPNPIEMVKTAYPHLAADLVERLADLDRYARQPAILALHATAKITNVPENISSVRALQKYLRGSKKLREKMSQEEFEKVLIHFLEYIKCGLAKEHRIAELKEKETPPDNATE
jgi:hypothetical protein